MEKKDKDVVNSDDEKPQARVLSALIGDQAIQSSRYVLNFVRNMSLLHPLSTPRDQFENSSLVKIISSVMSTVEIKTVETPKQLQTTFDTDTLLKAFILPPYPLLRYPLTVPPVPRFYGYLQSTDRPSLVQRASRMNCEHLVKPTFKIIPKLDLLSIVKQFAEEIGLDPTSEESVEETEQQTLVDRNLAPVIEMDVDESSEE